jgi:hypothetical protein
VATRRASDAPKIDLVHPLYLDVPMLISFLATLEGGVSYSSEVAEVAQRAKKSTAEGSAEGKLPGLTSLLGLSLSLSGRLQRDTDQSQSVESKFVRQHTAASLFNSLRHRLVIDDTVQEVRTSSDLATVSAGSLVEISGRIDESPLQRLVDFVKNIFPFVEEHVQAELKKLPTVKRNQRERMSTEQRQQVEVFEAGVAAMKAQVEGNKQTIKMMELIEQDLKSSPLSDLVVQGNGVAGFLSAHREFLTDDLTAGVLGGTFKVLGKATAVDSAATAQAPVVRRGAMGSLSESVIESMLRGMRDSAQNSGIRLDLPEGHLRGPYVQLIPLAIFI